MKEMLIQQLRMAKSFFDNSMKCFSEADSGFSPTPEMFTTAQQVAHVAQTIDWFMDGAFKESGFDMNWDAHMAEVKAVVSLKSASDWLNRSIENAVLKIEKSDKSDWHQPIADGPIMGGAPRFVIGGALSDHTAHHRGSLAVYARLLGKIPPMPYV